QAGTTPEMRANVQATIDELEKREQAGSCNANASLTPATPTPAAAPDLKAAPPPTAPATSGAAPPPPPVEAPPPPPIYRRWWFWAAAGAVAVGATVGIVAGTASHDPPSFDVPANFIGRKKFFE